MRGELKNKSKLTSLAVMLLSSLSACSGVAMHERNRSIFEEMMNVGVGCSFVNSVRNNPYTERMSIKDGRADYVSRSLKSACVIGFTIDEKASTSACTLRLPTEEAKSDHMQRGLGNGQPAWKGEVTGVIVSWRYISDPSLCVPDFSGK
jgi:hypothetical protein